MVQKKQASNEKEGNIQNNKNELSSSEDEEDSSSDSEDKSSDEDENKNWLLYEFNILLSLINFIL